MGSTAEWWFLLPLPYVSRRRQESLSFRGDKTDVRDVSSWSKRLQARRGSQRQTKLTSWAMGKELQDPTLRPRALARQWVKPEPTRVPVPVFNSPVLLLANINHRLQRLNVKHLPQNCCVHQCEYPLPTQCPPCHESPKY